MNATPSRMFSIRVGDRIPYLAYDFGFSLTLATGVTFSARDNDTALVYIDRQAAVIANGIYTINGEQVTLTPASGVAFYPWAALDTAVARKSVSYLFHIIWPGNLQESMPSEGYERGKIVDNF